MAPVPVLDLQEDLLGLAQVGRHDRTAHAAAVYKAQRFSDHAPLQIDYDYVL